MEPEAVAFMVMTLGGLFIMSPVMIVRMILRHREQMTALKYRQEGAPGLIDEVSALRREVAALRETTTKFDVAFDTALTRLEERMDQVEGRPATQTAPGAAPNTIPLSRGGA